MARKSDYMR